MGPTLAGLAKAALPDRRVIGVARFSEPGVKEWLRGARHRDHQLRPAGRGRDQRAAEIAKHHLHGRAQIRRRRQSGADLGDELARAGAGRAGLSGLAHRRLLDRLRLSVRARRRQRLGRNHAAQSARRICAILRRARAHVRIFLAPVQNAGPAVPPELCDRHALWRAARHRHQGARRASRSTSASAMSISSGRATPPRRRCAASRIATRRPRRSMSAATRSSPCAISQRNSASCSARRPSSSARRSRPPGSPTPRRR